MSELYRIQYVQELYLGKNKITTMEGMEQLTELKILSIPVTLYTRLLYPFTLKLYKICRLT